MDVLLEMPLLSQYQALTREGHLEQTPNAFACVKKKPKFTLYFDPTLPKVDYSQFTTKHQDFLE